MITTVQYTSLPTYLSHYASIMDKDMCWAVYILNPFSCIGTDLSH